MVLLHLKQFFSGAIQDIDNQRLPYPFEQLNIRTKIIAIVCLTIITISLVLKYFKKMIIFIQAVIQKAIQSRKNKQIKDISEMFDEKVNIKAESVDNLVHLMDKFQGKSLNQKYEQMNAFKQNPQSYTDANFAYKPRNFQLLERIRRENEEREQQNDPNIVNRHNRNAYNQMNDFANYSMANGDQFKQNYNLNDNMYSQSMQAPQQKFITAEDGLPSGTILNRNGIDLFNQPKFGQSIFNDDIQKPINRQNAVFFSFADEPQAFKNNIIQQQTEIYNKINTDLKSTEQKEMELEDHTPQVLNEQEKQNQTVQQNNVENQEIIENKIQEENNNNSSKQTKKKNEALKRYFLVQNQSKNLFLFQKRVIKNKLISKNTNSKFIKPTKSSVIQKNEIRAQKDINRNAKKSVKFSQRQQQEEDYYNNYEDDDEEEEDYDEEFIIYKKAKKLQAVPFKKHKKISKTNQLQQQEEEEDYLGSQSLQKPRKNYQNQIDLSSQSLNVSSKNSQQQKVLRNYSNQDQFNSQNNQQIQNNLLPSQNSQRQSSNQQIQLQQQQQSQQQQQIGLQQQISQQQIPSQNQQNQHFTLPTKQDDLLRQQQPIQLGQSSQAQLVNQPEQLNIVGSNLGVQNSNEGNVLSLLPPPKSTSQKWNFPQKNLPFFDLNHFQHQNIEVSQKVGFNVYDEKNNKGYKAFVFNNQNSYIMPIDPAEAESQEEKKEDKSTEEVNNEEVPVSQ